jgi:1,4-alpha-glucan branching enzyme
MNPSTLPDEDFYPLIEARHCDPFKILGVREFQGSWFARVFRPDVAKAILHELGGAGRTFELSRIHPDGFFEAHLGTDGQVLSYELELTAHDGHTWRQRDPYSFGPILGEMDVYLFNEGTHYEIYKKLGAHLKARDGVSGTHFAVWAPNAQRVSIVGDFPSACGRGRPLQI